MKDKNFLFTISLPAALFLLVILSCFVENTVIDNISQAIGVPLLLFTLSSFSFSVIESISNEYKILANMEREKLNSQTYRKAHFKIALTTYDEIESLKITLDSPIENNKKEINDEIEKIDKESNAICHRIAFFEQIEREMNKNKIIPVLYVLSLCFLLIALILPHLISPIFSFVKSSTLTLISFLFPILEIVIKEPLSNKIVSCKIRKYRERLKNSQTK